MYSLISYAVSWLLPDDVNKEHENNHDPVPDNNQNYSGESQVIPNDCPFLVHNNENVKTRSIEGMVTHMFHGHGLINGDIYFSIEAVQGEDRNLKV